MLWAAAMERGYSAPLWMTFRQAVELGAYVRKGEKGTPVVFASKITRTGRGEQGDDVEREIPFLKSYYVFNVEQIDGLPAHYTATHPPRLNPEQRIARADAFFAAIDTTMRRSSASSARCCSNRMTNGRSQGAT